MAIRTFKDYIDQYGMSGYKAGGGYNAPLVVMLRDEVANPGSTQLSTLDRAGLVKLAADMPANASAEQWLGNANMPFLTLHFDGSAVPILTPPKDPSQIGPMMDAAYKQYGAVLYTHDEKDNPFIQHTDRLENDGSITKDIAIGTNVNALSSYYQGALSSSIQGTNYFSNNNMVHTPAEMTNMLKLVIQYGVDSVENVQKYFGSYSYAPGVAAAAIASETKLPVLAALTDPLAATLEKAYIAYFGRPADTGGLGFWVDSIHKTGTVEGMINNFGNSSEYHNLYGHSTSAEIVNSLYQHLFNRSAEKAGLDYWANHMDAGDLTLTNIAFNLVNGALGSDLTILNEKISAATTFTAALDTQREVDLYANEISAQNARKWLSTIGEDHNVNVQIVGIANDVINQLQGNVDGVLAAHGLHAAYY